MNQKTFSLTARVIDRIDPLLALTDSRQITFIGNLPNEFYDIYGGFDDQVRSIRASASLETDLHINFFNPHDHSVYRFVHNLRNNHGLDLTHVTDGHRIEIAQRVIELNMPVWPAEGSVDLIDNVIVINFGIAGIDYMEIDGIHVLTAKHWISPGHSHHIYDYTWIIHQNGDYYTHFTTNTNQIIYDFSLNNDYIITVIVKNSTVDYTYPAPSLILHLN